MVVPAQAGARRDGSDGQEPSELVVPVPGLPVSTLREALPHLRRPFTAEAIKFKVQTVFKDAKGCIIVGYIDARLVIERLNAVVAGEWDATYAPVDGNPKLEWCALRVFDRVRRDVGESGKGMSKDLVSDALKRAAVQFGIGVSIYAVPQITLWADPKAGLLEQRMTWDKQAKKEKPTLVLTEKGHRKLREGYAKWLEEHGVPLFGQALDHGDVVGETVDPDVDGAEEEFTPEAPPALEDEKAVALTDRCKAAYQRIAEAGGAREIPPAKFQSWLSGAAHSHDELERLAVYLESRADELEATS